MRFILDNWYLFVAVAAVIACLSTLIIHFITMPRTEQVSAFKEWLKYGVTIAEKELGGGTGQLKLRMVWDLALTKFPWLSKVMEFEKFAEYVDEALVWLNNQLTYNSNLSNYVEGGGAYDSGTTELH